MAPPRKIGAVLALAAGLVVPANAAHTHAPGIVGTYRVVTHATTGQIGVSHATFYIDTFAQSTGAITGHGNQGSVSTFTITGTVKGSALVMRVTDPAVGYTAYDRGTIAPDGNIAGTLTDSNYNTGMWTMTRLVSPATASTGAVIVEKTGWGQEFQGHISSLYSWGVVIANRSTTRDAVGVTVSVVLLASGGIGEYDARDYTITVIPAGHRFYIGDGAGAVGGVGITRVTASVHVRAMQPKRYLLPPVSRIRLDRANQGVTAEMTNPYSTAINLYDAAGYVVVFDRDGRVIGGGNATPLADPVVGRTTLKPGAHLRVGFPVSLARVASVGISIDPG